MDCKSCLRRKEWPTLRMTEIVLVTEETAEAGLVRPLIAFLIESLAN
jgi:hypothetical protein